MATVTLHPHAEASDVPLVLLAPFPCDHRVWEEVAVRLGGDVLTVDPPGFGGDADPAPSLEGYVRALLAALDARGVRRFVVAGNSMGGYAAMALAELEPERLAGIGLFGTKAVADAPEAVTNRLAMAAKADAGVPASELLAGMKPNLLGASTKANRPDALAELERLTDAATPTGIAWAQRAMAARPDRTDALRALRVPAVVVWGAEDALMGAEVQAPMADALGVEVTAVPACGHLVPLEAPDAAVEALAGLWQRAREASGN